MRASISWMEKNYNEFNEKYFNNELPMCTLCVDRM